MTREEAQNLLNNSRPKGNNAYSIMLNEALNMAIKALEQEPCKDAISRAKAVKVASGYCHPANVANELAKLPPVTPQEPCDKCVYSTKDGDCQYDDITDTIPPFDDVISRQAVLDLIVANHTELNGVNVVMYSPLYKDIKQLPPVTPQQSCEDIAKAFQLGIALGFAKKHDEMDKVMEEVKKAVTPQPKTGHWIEKDGFDGDTYYDCSECGESWTTIEGTPWDNEFKYCPNCGCRMVEPQESEDKE